MTLIVIKLYRLPYKVICKQQLSLLLAYTALAEESSPTFRTPLQDPKTLVHIGDSGAGEVAKAANQLALIVTIQGIAEAVVFARANGVDFKPVWEALTKGFAGSRMLEIVGQRMLEQQFVMGMDASLHLKDSLIILQCAHESRTATPGAALAAQAFNALFARPGVKWDSAAILKVMEEMNGGAR